MKAVEESYLMHSMNTALLILPLELINLLTPNIIREFVRPSYGSARTWGTVTSSYGGVGSACQLFKRRGQGSISRSHQHYGSGCIN